MRFKGQLQFISKESTPPEDRTTPSCVGHKLPPEYIKTLLLKKYSEKTVKVYTSLFLQFMNYFRKKQLDEISDEEVRDYLLYLSTKRKVSDSYLN